MISEKYITNQCQNQQSIKYSITGNSNPKGSKMHDAFWIFFELTGKYSDSLNNVNYNVNRSGMGLRRKVTEIHNNYCVWSVYKLCQNRRDTSYQFSFTIHFNTLASI